MVKAGIEYHAPAHFDDVLDIGVRVAQIGNSSLQFAVGIFRADQQLIGGELIYVNADPVTRKSVRVNDELRTIIERFEGRQAAGR